MASGSDHNSSSSRIIYGGFPKLGSPKWMVYDGKSYSNGWLGDTTIYGNHHIWKQNMFEVNKTWTCVPRCAGVNFQGRLLFHKHNLHCLHRKLAFLCAVPRGFWGSLRWSRWPALWRTAARRSRMPWIIAPRARTVWSPCPCGRSMPKAGARDGLGGASREDADDRRVGTVQKNFGWLNVKYVQLNPIQVSSRRY